MKELMTLLEDRPDERAALLKKQSRLGNNLRLFTREGEGCTVALATAAVEAEPESAPSDSNSGRIRTKTQDRLYPLGYSSFWNALKYDRKAHTGLRIWFVDRSTCEPCRELPVYERRYEWTSEQLLEAR
jgi:hypothetical protein